MQRKPLVLLFSFLIFSFVARAEDVPTIQVPVPPGVDQSITPQSEDVSTPDQMGDADPLDVVEKPGRHQVEPQEPVVPQFTEVPEAGKKTRGSGSSSGGDSSAPTARFVPPPPEVEKTKTSKSSKKVSSEEASSVQGDDPDLHREERFHAIYQSYNSQPTPDEAWDKATAGRPSQSYQVQKGDTLWDVSNTFFGDPQYWPKIWSLNSDRIGNPHEINPKMAVQFFPGTVSDAPTVALGDKATVTEQAGSGTKAATEENIRLPVNRHNKPVLQNIPPSIPVYRYSGRGSAPKVSVDIGNTGERHYPTMPEYLTYYVSQGAVQGAGEVVETELGMKTAVDFQYVIVRLKGAGKDFYAVKNLDPIKDLQKPDRQTNLVEVEGAIQIIGKVNESKNLYRAIVKKTILPIYVGAILLEGDLPTFNPEAVPATSTVPAVIIGGQNESQRRQFDSHGLVFLNAGSAKGLQEGQALNIYSDVRNRNGATEAVMNDRAIGVVKIIRVTDGFATAYITHSSDDVFIGDHVGSATPVGPVASAPSAGSSDDLSIDTPAEDAPAKDVGKPLDEKAKGDDLDLEL